MGIITLLVDVFALDPKGRQPRFPMVLGCHQPLNASVQNPKNSLCFDNHDCVPDTSVQAIWVLG